LTPSTLGKDATMDDMPEVTGSWAFVPMIGDPIRQVKTPARFNARLRALGVDALMAALQVPADRLSNTAGALLSIPNVRGMVVTIPHKQAIAGMADVLTPAAARVGAVNALARRPDGWHGGLFDGTGFMHALRAQDFQSAGARVVQIGAGGAGAAIADALVEAGAAEIILSDLDGKRARNLAARINEAHSRKVVFVGEPQAGGADLLVNASPLGMRPGDGLPPRLGPLGPGLYVFDIVTVPTPLMAAARDAGAQVLGGEAMIAAQIDALVEFIFPETAGRAV
jgi:shikimate dehydrogenase